jgi:hypothetical protein
MTHRSSLLGAIPDVAADGRPAKTSAPVREGPVPSRVIPRAVEVLPLMSFRAEGRRPVGAHEVGG